MCRRGVLVRVGLSIGLFELTRRWRGRHVRYEICFAASRFCGAVSYAVYYSGEDGQTRNAPLDQRGPCPGATLNVIGPGVIRPDTSSATSVA
jgi:hypothetical protein